MVLDIAGSIYYIVKRDIVYSVGVAGRGECAM